MPVWEVFMMRTFKSLAFILVVVLMAVGCQALTGATLGENIVDTNITATAKATLVVDKAINLTRVSAKTYQGTVYLTGMVDSAEQKTRVEQLTSQVGGVKEVVNNLRVQER